MIAIPAKDIGLLEYKIRPMLDKALDNTSDPQIDNTDHWIELLKCGAVYSTTNRIFYINIVAGSNLKKYAQNCIEDISSFANFLGCKMIISQARLGAAKELKKNGFNEVKYVKKHVTMMKVIGDSTDY